MDDDLALIAQEIAQAIDVADVAMVESVQVAGAGYVNFKVNVEMFSRLT